MAQLIISVVQQSFVSEMSRSGDKSDPMRIEMRNKHDYKRVDVLEAVESVVTCSDQS